VVSARAGVPKEHPIQVKVHEWVRECVPAPKVFIAFDRSKKTAQFTHLRQKAAGIRKGTADTLLMVPGLPDMWVELKRPGERPDDAQEKFGTDVKEVGRIWGWTDSVIGYAQLIAAWGVPVSRWDFIRAEHLDAVLLGRAMKEAGVVKVRKASKPRAPKPSPSQVRKLNRMRSTVMF